ncbi:hypothetical protein Aduo_018482 [Ancylostoma duodenale]
MRHSDAAHERQGHKIYDSCSLSRSVETTKLKTIRKLELCNQDRHHYESFAVFENLPSYAIHLDNGRAFGRTDIDDDDIILPLRQCCVIRPSTLNTLLQFYSEPQALTKALHA